MKFRALLAAAIVAASALFSQAPVAEAQVPDWRLNPSYGTVNLRSGFQPDPWRRTLQAGGDLFVSFQNGCQGWVARRPDWRMNYSAGRYVLSMYVRAQGDTIIVVNDPQGQWYCNDDYSGFDPAIYLTNPMSGQYDIWVGTYNRNRVPGARLYISENQPFVNF